MRKKILTYKTKKKILTYKTKKRRYIYKDIIDHCEQILELIPIPRLIIFFPNSSVPQNQLISRGLS